MAGIDKGLERVSAAEQGVVVAIVVVVGIISISESVVLAKNTDCRHAFARTLLTMVEFIPQQVLLQLSKTTVVHAGISWHATWHFSRLISGGCIRNS